MASSGLSVFSEIAAAAAGLAGEKVYKNGSIPGLGLAAIAGGSGTGANLASIAAMA